MVIQFSVGQLLGVTAMVFAAFGLVVVVAILRIRAKRVGGWHGGQTRRSVKEAED